MKVHPSHTGEATAAQSHGKAAEKLATKSSASAASFASVLAKQSPATAQTTEPKAIKLHKGESTRAVDGHSYAEISGGKRDGMYINMTNNKRRGQAFVLVERNGREYHIYGSGKDRLVVALRKRDPDHDTTRTTVPNTAASTGGATPTVSAT
jgi:hypothetical protein